MHELLAAALETARLRGAEYADVRIGHYRRESISVRNGAPGPMSFDENIGYGVRVIAGGAWGFAACDRMDRESVQRAAASAVAIAQAASAANSARVQRVAEPPAVDFWSTPLVLDPFKVSLESKFELLHRIDRILKADPRIRVATGDLAWQRRHVWFASSEGSRIEQVRTITGGGYTVLAVADGEFHQRSYPNSFGRQSKGMGWELIAAMDLEGNAERVREEAIQLLTAPACPAGTKDLILTGDQMVLQIHESVGHASELDRVLGYEANYAGTSFATTEKLGNFRYGSDIVNLVADTTAPTGLATMGYDDDGVAAQRWPIVKAGILSGYMTNRETAGVVGQAGSRSRGCNRADSWASLPITRIANLSLMPGTWKLADLIADTGDGLLMSTNRSWSIDQRRLNFQFGCEIGWLIKGGKLAGVVRNPTYQGITPQFWGSCDAICDHEHWDLWGVMNCGKGQPGQVSEMSHGAAPARFRGVTVGV
ncbi:MAG: TldD/PmbA family protein [Phycisphaerae bacterium]|nr:TldD/PmbA family protein [Phycisphaerae bacterium]